MNLKTLLFAVTDVPTDHSPLPDQRNHCECGNPLADAPIIGARIVDDEPHLYCDDCL